MPGDLCSYEMKSYFPLKNKIKKNTYCLNLTFFHKLFDIQNLSAQTREGRKRTLSIYKDKISSNSTFY